MNYIQIVLIFSLSLPTQLYSSENVIISYLYPIIKRTLHHITTFFVPANRRDLEQTKKEIFELIKKNSQEQQQITCEAIDALFEQTKKELQQSIDTTTHKCIIAVAAVQKNIQSAREDSTRHIKKNHDARTDSLKNLLTNHMQNIQKYNDQFIQKIIIVHHNNSIYLQELCKKTELLLQKVQLQRNKNTNTTKESLKLLFFHLARIKNKFDTHTKNNEQLLTRLINLNKHYQSVSRSTSDSEDHAKSDSRLYLFLDFLLGK